MDFDVIAKVARYGNMWDLLPGVFDQYLPHAAYGPSVARVLDYLRGRSDEVPDIVSAWVDAPLLANLPLLRSMVDWNDFTIRPAQARARFTSPAADEDIARMYPGSWTLYYLLNYVLLSSIRPSKAAAVVVGMRDDGIRVLEWIAHYRALGFEGIFIYTNDNRDRSEELLGSLARAGVITLIDSEVTGQISPQRKAFEHALHGLVELRDYQWVMFADSDEFLTLPAEEGFAIQAKLDTAARRYPFFGPSAICFFWKVFVSGYAFAQSAEPLLSRFRHSTAHGAFKSMVRLRDTLSMVKLHFPICPPDAFFVDASVDLIPQSRTEEQNGMWTEPTMVYRGGQLNHYWCKSFEEFYLKQGRGADAGAADYHRSFEQFFDWNADETPGNFDPPAEAFVLRVREELEWLRSLAGVVAAEAAVWTASMKLLDTYSSEADRRDLYSTLATARGLPLAGKAAVTPTAC